MSEYTAKPAPTFTGINPDAKRTEVRHLNLKERIEIWFIRPLRALKGDDAFIALMVMFPLIEKIIRFQVGAADDYDLNFSEGSAELKALAKLLGGISYSEAAQFWKGIRHGIVHRGMIMGTNYVLSPAEGAKPVETVSGHIIVHVWQLRRIIVDLLDQVGAKMWRDETCPLPTIYQQ